jgi:DNA-binding NtrC family response regulator
MTDKAILAIDSESSWLEFCEETLRAHGYAVATAPTLPIARAWLTSQAVSQVRLILIDIKFLLDDPAFVAEVITPPAEAASALPCAVAALFSTDLTPTKTRAAFRLGVSDCVSKPYDESALLALVEQMLADCRFASELSPAPLGRSGTVLVIDDDEDWLASLTEALPDNVKYETAATYADASQKIAAQRFDLVICDLRLVDDESNNFEGMNLIRDLRTQDEARGTWTEVIIVSAYGTPEHIRESYRDFKIYYFFDKRYFAPPKYRNVTLEALRQ